MMLFGKKMMPIVYILLLIALLSGIYIWLGNKRSNKPVSSGAVAPTITVTSVTRS